MSLFLLVSPGGPSDFLQRRAIGRHPCILGHFLWTRRGRSGGVLLGVQPRRQEQRYRIDATIVLFGVPVYRRKGVGSGWARIEESAGERWLRFAAGSLPGNAQGLNRLGFVEERASQDGSHLFRIHYGFARSRSVQAQKVLVAAAAVRQSIRRLPVR